MKKTLLALLGIAGLSGIGLSAFSQEKDINRENKKEALEYLSENKIFPREKFDKYTPQYYLSKDERYLIADYDINKDKNKITDVTVYFEFLGMAKINRDTSYITLPNASAVFVDENGDAVPDWVYLNMDKDIKGILETKKTYKEYLEYLNSLKKRNEDKNKIYL